LKQHPGGANLFCQTLDVPRSRVCTPTVVPLTLNEAHDQFHRALAGSKWRVLRGWHVLRHSFASNLAAEGVDQRIINDWMGHQSEAMVRRYRHLLPSQEHDALRLAFGR